MNGYRKYGLNSANAYEYTELENLLDERSLCGNMPHSFTVEELRMCIRKKLLGPIRFLRTSDFQYINPETDDLLDAYFVNDVQKNYAFLYAAFIGDNVELLQSLHQQGADVNFTYPGDNLNALHMSALRGSIHCVRWLLEKGCRIVDTVSDHLSPLHFAVLSDSRPTCQFLVENGCRVDAKALHKAVWVKALDCVDYLLELEAPINEYDESGMTALHIASYIGHTKIMQSLLRDPRINVNAKTKLKRYTALHLAAENGFHECLEMLLEKGANVDEFSINQQTPLYLACREIFVDCVELLLEHGAAVNLQDDEGRTPLHAAVSKMLSPMLRPTQIQVIRQLIDRQADVHLADSFGFTALHIAALNELDGCVELLILSGANVAAKTKGEVTALNMMNRKTPSSSGKIEERLDLCLAYNQEQLLKFSFRDINRNSTVGEVGYLYTLQKEGQAKVLEHPLCVAFLHLKWQKVRIFILLRLAIALVTVVFLSLLVLWGIDDPGCYRELLKPVLGAPTRAELFYQNSHSVVNSTEEHCWNTTLQVNYPLSFDTTNCSQNVCKNVVLSTSANSSPGNVSTWLVTMSCSTKNISSMKPVRVNDSVADACSAEPGILGRFVRAYPFVPGCMWIFIMVMLVANTIRIIFTLAAYRSSMHFFMKYSNIIEGMVTICVPLTLINMFTVVIGGSSTEDYEILRKSLSSFTLLSAWAFVTIMVSQLPTIGTYVAMFRKVLTEFLKMITAFLCLLMGFTFTFCTLRSDKFINPIVGYIKIMGMMTGELNSSDLLDDTNDMDMYTTGFVLWVFMIIISVVLMNLLVGIAVNDVEGLRKNADLAKRIQQTKLIHFLEKSCFKGFFPSFMMDILRQFLFIWPDSYTGVVMYVRPLSPDETRLPKDVMDAGLQIALSRLKKKKLKEADKKPTVEDRVHSLEKKIDKLQEIACKLQVTLETVVKNTRRISGSNSEVDSEDDVPE